MPSDILGSLVFPVVFTLVIMAILRRQTAKLFKVFGYMAFIGPALYTTYCVYDVISAKGDQTINAMWNTLSNDQYVVTAVILQAVLGVCGYLFIKYANNH